MTTLALLFIGFVVGGIVVGGIVFWAAQGIINEQQEVIDAWEVTRWNGLERQQ